MSKEQLEHVKHINVTEGLTQDEDKLLADLLGKWEGGRISQEVFTRLCRMIPQPIIEVVFMRENNGRLETLTIPRPEGDLVWPGMYHTPGTALRTADYDREDQNPLNGAFSRIQREVRSEIADTPTHAGKLFRKGDRGPEVVEVYLASLPEGVELPQEFAWLPVDELAKNDNFIQSQLGHVQMAAEFYSQNIHTQE